jgi:hypothetical protein
VASSRALLLLECRPSCFLVLLLFRDLAGELPIAMQALQQLKAAAVAAFVATAFAVPVAVEQQKQTQKIQTFMCFSGQKV